MALKYVSDCVELLLKLTVLLMFVFSTSSTKQCTPKTTERDSYVIKNVGIKLCQLKCVENGHCLSIEYDIETLTCRLSRDEAKKIKKKEGHVILARDHSHVPTGSCTSSMCTFGQRRLKTRSGKAVCVQDEKQNDPEESPRHKVDKQETFANSPLHEACRKGDLHKVKHILSQSSVDINSRDEKHGRTPLMMAAKEGHCKMFKFLIRKGSKLSEVDNDCKNALHWACKGGHVGMVECVLQQNSININARNMHPLLQAARLGYRDVLEFLVCTGSNVSQVNDAGYNVLHVACFGGQLDIVKYLVSQGSVDINRSNKNGITPLMAAALNGHKDVFEFLVSMGANVSHVDNSGSNVLHFAIIMGHMSVVKFVVSHGSVDINGSNKNGTTPLMEAVLRGHKDVFEFLAGMGANVSHVDASGNNVLHFAMRTGNIAIVKYLVSQGSVDINSRRKDGRTPLIEAAFRGHTDVFEYLVSMGANVSHVDDDGDNVLHFAMRTGNIAFVKYLVSQGSVDINSRRKDGRTPLIEAAFRGHTDVFAFLVSTGANVSHVDNSGNNILHFATIMGHMPVVKFLVSQSSVDINGSNKNGTTPLMEAVLRGHKDVFEFLVSMGANVSHVDDDGDNVLHLASSSGHVEMVKHILSQNLVDIYARDKYGKTAAMKAKRRRKLKVYNLLVSRGCPVK